MTIKLTNEESLDYFLSALCNSLGYMGGYGLELSYKDGDYESARQKVTNPCYEDVLIQILKDGGELTMLDIEGDGDNTKSISLKDVYERVEKMPARDLIDYHEENDDANTGDVLLQTVFFGEVIFG